TTRLFSRVGGYWSTYLNAPCAKVEKLAMGDPVAATASGKLKTIGTDMRERATVERAIPSPLSQDRARHAHRSLRESSRLNRLGRFLPLFPGPALEAGRKIPFRMGKCQSAEDHIAHSFSSVGVRTRSSFDPYELRKPWRKGFDAVQCFAWPRQVINSAGIFI